MERLSAENRLLESKIAVAGVVHPLVQKKTICLNVLESPGDMFASFLTQFEALTPQQGKAHRVVATYIMCGLPLSGKSYWIEQHEPSEPGVHIYVDSCAHTGDARRFIADRIRHITESDVHCVWLRASAVTCVGRAVVIDATTQATLKKREIEQVASDFEPPVFEEPFDSIILPRERL